MKESNMTERLTITQWAEEDRPREKMMLHGASALSNAELLAILIGSGSNEESAVELSDLMPFACFPGRVVVRLTSFLLI
mgnify:CR=1 FL=1